MVQNPHLKVLFAGGYFDLATPFFASDYTVNHLNVGPALRGNITQTYYTAGHMVYHELASLQKLKADVKAFINQALAMKPQ
jgi:carboxypeptidase C (cathepsin A)